MAGRMDIERRLKELSSPSTFDLDPAAFARTLMGESARGCIILAVTAIDEALRARLIERFSGTNSSDRSNLFGLNGPAGTFSARILLAKSLGIIETGTQNRINLLRHLRNACAHAQNEMSFDSDEVRQVLEYFTVSANPPVMDMPTFRVRDAFISMCMMLASSIRTNGSFQEAYDRVGPILEPLMRETLRQAATFDATNRKPKQ